MPIQIGEMLYHHQVYVTPDMADEFILGLDFMKKNDVSLNIRSNGRSQLSLAKEGITVPCVFGQGGGASANSCKLVATTAKTIPARQAQRVDLRVPQGTRIEWYDQGEVTGLVTSPLINMPIAVSLSSRGTTVLIHNHSEEPIDIIPGQALALFFPRRIRTHKDKHGNVYLYRDLNGNLVERMDVCEPWEEFGVEDAGTLKFVGSVPVCKRVYHEQDGKVWHTIDTILLRESLPKSSGNCGLFRRQLISRKTYT